MKRKKRNRRKRTAGATIVQIKTMLDFGEEGVPLERLGEITTALKERHLDFASRSTDGFVAISFDRYVDLHLQNNPSTNRAEFVSRLREAVRRSKSRGALSLRSVHLGNWIGRSGRRMLYLHYRRGLAR